MPLCFSQLRLAVLVCLAAMVISAYTTYRVDLFLGGVLAGASFAFLVVVRLLWKVLRPDNVERPKELKAADSMVFPPLTVVTPVTKVTGNGYVEWCCLMRNCLQPQDRVEKVSAESLARQSVQQHVIQNPQQPAKSRWFVISYAHKAHDLPIIYTLNSPQGRHHRNNPGPGE